MRFFRDSEAAIKKAVTEDSSRSMGRVKMMPKIIRAKLMTSANSVTPQSYRLPPSLSMGLKTFSKVGSKVLDVLPGALAKDSSNSFSCDPKPSPKRTPAKTAHSGLVESPNFKNLGFGKFVMALGFTSAPASFFNSILDIVLLRSKEKVCRSYARRIITSMANYFPERNRPIMQFPRKAGGPYSLSVNHKHAVSLPHFIRGPIPTAVGLVNVPPESRNSRAIREFPGFPSKDSIASSTADGFRLRESLTAIGAAFGKISVHGKLILSRAVPRMATTIAGLFLALSLSNHGYADSTTNRMGLTIPTVGSANWGPRVNSNFQLIDSTAAAQGKSNAFTSTNTFGGYSQFTSTVNFQNLKVGTGQCLGVDASSNTVRVACGTGGGGGGGGVIAGTGNLYDTPYVSVASSSTLSMSSNLKIFPSSVTILGAVPILSTGTLQSGTTVYVSSATLGYLSVYIPGTSYPSTSSGGTGLLSLVANGSKLDAQITSMTSGKLPIGKTVGGGYALANLTGTANQLVVTNGDGTITLSLPQSIASVSSPTFSSMTITGGGIRTNSITWGDGTVQVSSPVAGGGGSGANPSGTGSELQSRLNGTTFAAVVGSSATATGPVFSSATATTLYSSSINDSGLTSGRVTFAGASGLLSDSSMLTFNSGTGELTGGGKITAGSVFDSPSGYYIGGASFARYGHDVTDVYVGNGSGFWGVNETCVGYQACNGASGLPGIGNDNTCIGYTCGFSFGNSGSSNVSKETCIGSGACYSDTKGTQNVAIGFGAAATMTSGQGNTCAGYAACDLLTTGIGNTVYGDVAGADITVGSRNTCIGGDSNSAQPCTGIISGSSNTAVGNGAGGNTSYAGTESANTALGYKASWGPNVSRSLSLGYLASAISSNTAAIGSPGLYGLELDVVASTMTPYELTIGTSTAVHHVTVSTAGLMNVTALSGASLSTCGDSTHAIGYASSTGLFSCQAITGSGSGGSSALEVMAGGVRISSPTASLNAVGNAAIKVTGTLVAGTTAQLAFSADPSSVTLQGVVTAASLGALTANQSITLSGDVAGSGATAITTTLASVVTANQFGSVAVVPVVTFDAKGRITAVSSATLAGTVGTSWDGGGSALTTGTTYWLQMPSSGTITGYTITANPSGSMTVNVSSSAAFGFLNAGLLCAAACPSLSGATTKTDNTISGWTTAVAKDSFLYFVINTAATSTQANLSVRFNKS